jgi:DNA-binding NarL/FixJ family response regulator
MLEAGVCRRLEIVDVPMVERVPVLVQAADPISRAGAVGQLRQHPVVEVVEDMRGRSGAVVVLLADAVDQSTMAGLRRLVRSDGARPVLVVGGIREAELLDVIECGVGAILRRQEATSQRLLQAVLAASRGEGNLPSDLLGRLITQVGRMRHGTPNQPGAPVVGLAGREIDVLRLVAEGMDTGEIAVKLSYSERTVKNVIHALTTRLHLRNRVHAVAYALREGYI